MSENYNPENMSWMECPFCEARGFKVDRLVGTSQRYENFELECRSCGATFQVSVKHPPIEKDDLVLIDEDQDTIYL